MTDDAAAYSRLRMQLQHDINCLSDPDRAKRRRSLDKLQRSLKQEAVNVSPTVLQQLVQNDLFTPLVSTASSDTIERCREKALQILLFLIEEQKAVVLDKHTVSELVSLLNRRMGKLPYPEATEELRLLLLQMTVAYLDQVPSSEESTSDIMSDLTNVLGKSSLDAFPDVKKITCECMCMVSSKWPAGVAMHQSALVKPLVQNLGHQHSRVRIATLQALQAVIPCGADGLPEMMNELVLPPISKLLFDRSAAVRKQLMVTVAGWCCEIEPLQKMGASLLPILLGGLVDESPEIQQLTEAKLPDVAPKLLSSVESDETMESSSTPLPPDFFQKQPPQSLCQFAVSIRGQVLSELLEKTSDWTTQVRERYTRITSAFVVLLGQEVNPVVGQVFSTLAKNCQDEEESVQDSVQQCSRVIGYYADPQLIFAALLPLIGGKNPGQSTAEHRVNGLVLLRLSLDGMSAAVLTPHLQDLTETLASPELRESEATEVQEQVAGVVHSVVKTTAAVLAQPEHDTSCFRLFWVLNQILASSSSDSPAHEVALTTLSMLSSALDEAVDALYMRYIHRLLDSIQLPSDASHVWQKGDPARLLFDFICRHSGAACGSAASRTVPVILLHLTPTQAPDIRLSFLVLLESMLGNDGMNKSFYPFNTQLIVEGIVPNIVWQGGRVAATVRKVGVACLYTMFRHELADVQCLNETASQIMPVLKSSMDDSDAKTRQLVCLAFQYLFVALPGRLSEEPVHQLYAEILKRLDDSDDTVRKAACQTFTTFLDAAPKEHFKGTIIDYSLDTFFVHLDDPDPSIQEAVMGVLKRAIEVDPVVAMKKAEENRSRHRNPTYCDEIRSLAEARMG